MSPRMTDECVCVSPCACVHYMSPVACLPQILSHFSALWTPTKNWSPNTAWLHPTSVTLSSQAFNMTVEQRIHNVLTTKMNYEIEISTVYMEQLLFELEFVMTKTFLLQTSELYKKPLKHNFQMLASSTFYQSICYTHKQTNKHM